MLAQISSRILLEQDTGVEPAFTAWEAVVLPIYESCVCEGIIAEGFGKFNPFLSKEEIPSGSGKNPCPCAAKKSS